MSTDTVDLQPQTQPLDVVMDESENEQAIVQPEVPQKQRHAGMIATWAAIGLAGIVILVVVLGTATATALGVTVFLWILLLAVVVIIGLGLALTAGTVSGWEKFLLTGAIIAVIMMALTIGKNGMPNTTSGPVVHSNPSVGPSAPRVIDPPVVIPSDLPSTTTPTRHTTTTRPPTTTPSPTTTTAVTTSANPAPFQESTSIPPVQPPNPVDSTSEANQPPGNNNPPFPEPSVSVVPPPS